MKTCATSISSEGRKIRFPWLKYSATIIIQLSETCRSELSSSHVPKPEDRNALIFHVNLLFANVTLLLSLMLPSATCQAYQLDVIKHSTTISVFCRQVAGNKQHAKLQADTNINSTSLGIYMWTPNHPRNRVARLWTLAVHGCCLYEKNSLAQRQLSWKQQLWFLDLWSMWYFNHMLHAFNFSAYSSSLKPRELRESDSSVQVNACNVLLDVEKHTCNLE